MRSAIIDIGYNAVRAVVYECDRLGAPEIFNDKFKSDIINLLNLDNLEVKHQAYLSLQYLIHIFDRLSVTDVKCVATAVLRGHPRAEEFREIVKRKFNINIEVISGDREAYLTAAGLISGINDACGIAADLGGGSLELAQIKDKKVGILKSLPLGTGLITNNHFDDINIISQMIKKEFEGLHCPSLYLIGGALRLIGRSYMEFVHYPLKNLHNLEINRKEFELYLERLTHANMLKMQYKSRIHGNAILVAKSMLNVFLPEKVIISNYGLKEGVRFDCLPKEEQQKDIIYERIKTLVNFDENTCSIKDYTEVIKPILIQPDTTTISIIALVIMLAQYNKNIDRTLRSNFIVEFILASDIPFSHRQRLMLSNALALTYTSRSDTYINRLAKRMINSYDYCNSHIIGNFIKIAREIDGPEFQSPSFSLDLKDNGYIEISTLNTLPKMVFEKVCERLKTVGLARKNIC
ncbi:MAG: Ppx/GppA family phosphatase [Rickettsia endosymbiont of Pseudomimeciton antennatum]|nr:Ppx/GppA family phosphatase [Rickettsia endosymbiont of Pseudomimeciton antennatum]MCC8398041.1 Ppx/GppA family phosphatase [Rickettsia endosymbiont of Labidopullus appendiculatus]